MLIVVQARMGSTRLPGKVLRRIRDETLLARVLRRLEKVRAPHRTVVATTEGSADDAIVEEARRAGAEVVRGSEHDVLSRYAKAARRFSGEVVVRVTADCPILDPNIVDKLVRAFAEADPPADYASNTLTRTYPRGLDVEVIRRETLDTADREAVAPWEREHVTPFIYERPDRFRLVGLRASSDHSMHRWTVDTEADLLLVSRIIEALEPAAPIFGMDEVLELLDRRPELNEINQDVVQKPIR